MNTAIPLKLSASTGAAFAERVRWRARRFVLWSRHLWQQDMTSAGQGLAITHGEVDRLLLDPEEQAAEEDRFYAADAAARAMQDSIARADLLARQDPDWHKLCTCFRLSSSESDLLSLALAVELDPGLRRVYAYLHDDALACHATQWLAARLFQWPSWTYCGPDSKLVFWRLARPVEGAHNPWSALTPWQADPAIVLTVKNRTWHDPALVPAVHVHPCAGMAANLCIYPDALAEMQTVAEAIRTTSHAPLQIELIGPAGSGKRTLAAQFAASLQRDLVVADAGQLFLPPSPHTAAERHIGVLRMARALGAIPYLHNDEEAAKAVPQAPWRSGRGMADIVIFSRTGTSAAPSEEGIVRHTIHLPRLTLTQREALWQQLSDRPVPAPVHDRWLTAGQLALVAAAAPAGPEAIEQACRVAAQPPTELLQQLPCPYAWDDLVVAPDLRRQLEEFEQQARLRWSVYEQWGFERLFPLGKGITALFAGPSGTGKTMAAQVIARALGCDLYRVDLAGVVNKYIGETEKRLKQVFDHCERGNVLLFFDEADALFGQRMQVKDAHDRFANIEIDYLLQRMEQFDGIAVLATNRKNELDKAFLRRLRFLVDFLPPGPEERRGLWRRALLPASPAGEPLLEEIDWTFLAEKLALTGADIKAAALSAAFLARAAGTRIGMRQIMAGVRREMTKHGILLRTSLEEGM